MGDIEECANDGTLSALSLIQDQYCIFFNVEVKSTQQLQETFDIPHTKYNEMETHNEC